MTAIDRAALIEKAAVAVGGASARTDGIHADRRRDAVDTVLPVIAAELLAPLRELHRMSDSHYSMFAGRIVQACASCGENPCPTIRLLDQIEADVKGGE